MHYYQTLINCRGKIQALDFGLPQITLDSTSNFFGSSAPLGCFNLNAVKFGGIVLSGDHNAANI